MQRETERLMLRDFVDEDWRAVWAYHGDARYLRFYPHTVRTEADVQAFVAMFLAQQRATPRTKFQQAVVLKDGDALIGNCGVRLVDDGGHEAEMGYEIAPEHWGKGYATEAGRAMLEFGFLDLQVHRISAWCIADNLASVRVLERLGFRREGVLREKERFKGRLWDVCLYGLLAAEWRAGVEDARRGTTADRKG
jgi:[ribosomal protein S5]-alanine N-acetyltransferase